ncbi:MAG: hypothetical protein J5986_02705 [Roseburia sp.]|nr:hypothetical protein [Roseburia sp.]
MKRSINKIHVIKTVAFLLIFVLLLGSVTDILQPKWIDGTSVTFVQENFYKEKKNSIEVAVLGSSQLVYGISSMRLLENYGISAYSLATGEQPVLCGYFYLREMARSQNIKTVIYDVSMLYEEEQESRFRKTIDTAPMSRNKLWMILEHRNLSFAESARTYFFPIMKYHSRWEELEEMDYHYADLNTEVFKGNIMSPIASQKINYEKLCVDNDEIDASITMDESELHYFREMVQYCKEQNIELILIKTPKTTWTKSAMVGVEALAEEYQLPYMDFNTAELLEASGIDIEKDFWNQDHLNIRGAEKLTDYMAEYLLANGTYTDGRNTEAYDEEEVRKYYIDRENKYLQTSNSLEDVMTALKNDRYEVVMQLTGDIASHWNENTQQLLEELGVSVNMAELQNAPFIGQYKNGNRFYEESQEKEFTHEGTFSNGTAYEATSNPSGNEMETGAKIAGEEIGFQKKGLNFCVYDTVNNKLVDNFTLYYDEDRGDFNIYRYRES